jgi:hypothetical protein
VEWGVVRVGLKLSVGEEQGLHECWGIRPTAVQYEPCAEGF